MATIHTSAVPIGRGGNRWLWAAQFLLCVGFVVIGLMKVLMSIPALAAMWPWAGELPEPIVRLLGMFDIAGGVGVFAPMLTGIRPRLTVLAAAGCAALQVCAMIFHTSRGEFGGLPVNAVFLALAVIIFMGRRKSSDAG